MCSSTGARELLGCCLGAVGPLCRFDSEGAVLASWALLAFGGRHLGAHMSQWHRARGGWGQGRVSSGRSSAKRKGGNRIPERWKDYLPVGQRMPGTRFIAFKVPLKKSFEENLAPEERFSPLDLFDKIEEQNEELGLIIDLTYTHRYYKPEDLPETIPYLKIYTVGHQVPDDDTIFKFKCAVNGFLKENKDNDKLIGVHCTHGLNRTGYLICRYLIDVEGMRPDDAIELFNSCRGHCLERQNYIEDLQNGPIREDWDSSVSRSGGCHYLTCVPTTKHMINRGPRNNMHWAQGHPTHPQHFHAWAQDMPRSVRKCSQNHNFYQRGHNPPPGPPWRGPFTEEVLLECKAKWQPSSPESEVVFWQLPRTVLSNLLWMDRVTQTYLKTEQD